MGADDATIQADVDATKEKISFKLFYLVRNVFFQNVSEQIFLLQ